MHKNARAGVYLPIFLWLALSGAAAAGCPDYGPEWCRAEVFRLESAYRAGRAAAATPGEAFDSLRTRNAGLMALVESTYASDLALVAGRGDLAEALQADQARWLADAARAELLLGESLPRRIIAQELLSDMLLERLRVLEKVARPRLAARSE